MAGDGRKFTLAWRPHEPVLEYALWGYWNATDAQAWKEAANATIARRPLGSWYMVGDLSGLKTQPDAVNGVRDEVTRIALANGLAGCVMYGITGVSLLQVQRLLAASGRAEQFTYAETSAEAERQLQRWMGRGSVHLSE